MRLHVACHAGYRGEETPRRIDLGERSVAVIEVIDRWYGPDHRYFKVAGDDGAVYILRQSVPAGDWQLTLYERGAAVSSLSREEAAP